MRVDVFVGVPCRSEGKIIWEDKVEVYSILTKDIEILDLDVSVKENSGKPIVVRAELNSITVR